MADADRRSCGFHSGFHSSDLARFDLCSLPWLITLRLWLVRGFPLGDIAVTARARAALTQREIYAVLKAHKIGPWDGVGVSWHECCLQGFDLPVRDGWEQRGQALYSGALCAGGMVLVCSDPERTRTTVLLGAEEGCSGWLNCPVCRELQQRQRQAEFQVMKRFVNQTQELQ